MCPLTVASCSACARPAHAGRARCRCRCCAGRRNTACSSSGQGGCAGWSCSRLRAGALQLPSSAVLHASSPHCIAAHRLHPEDAHVPPPMRHLQGTHGAAQGSAADSDPRRSGLVRWRRGGSHKQVAAASNVSTAPTPRACCLPAQARLQGSPPSGILPGKQTCRHC